MIVGMLFIGFLLVFAVIMLALRRTTLDEAAVEARLRQSDTHTLAYAVPDGQDPAVLRAALAREGYASMGDMEGGAELLIVACDEEDRAKVRSIIEHVDRAGFDGPAMHVGHVIFRDESPA